MHLKIAAIMTKKPALNSAININLLLIGTLTFRSSYTLYPDKSVYCTGNIRGFIVMYAYRHGDGHNQDIRRHVQGKTDNIVEIVLDPTFL